MKNDLSLQFDNLNKEIVASINARNYSRATLLDQARQKKILRQLPEYLRTLIHGEFSALPDQAGLRAHSLLR